MKERDKKSLLGVNPARLVVDDRNLELAKAIWERTSQEKKTVADYRLMVLWATEISMNCNMMLALDKTIKIL